MAAFKPFFRAHGDGQPVGDLKAMFEGLERDIPDLAAKTSKRTKDAMYQALREFEAARAGQCEAIPSEDQFYGVSNRANRLQKYAQCIFILALQHDGDEQRKTKP